MPDVFGTRDAVRAMLNALPAMVGYWDAGLRNRLANDAYVEYFGRSPEQMRGMHIRDLLGPDLFAKNLPYMERALAGEQQTFDRAIPLPSGEVRYTQASYIPDVVDGAVRGFFVLVTDITARHAMEAALAASEERYRTLVDHLPGSAITLVGPDLRLRWFGGGVAAREEFDVAALVGRPVRDTSGGGEHGARVEGLYRRALDGETVTAELHSPLTGRDFQVTVAPLRDDAGAVTAALGVAHDITDAKAVQAELTEERRLLLEARALEAALARIAELVARGLGATEVLDAVAGEVRGLLGAAHARVDHGDGAGALPVATAGHAPEGASILRAPVDVRGRPWGAVVAAFDGPVPGVAQERLDRFATLAGLAIANAAAWEELALLAATDPLTGLANRRTFDERLAAELARAQRHERSLSVVLLDLDHFKRINDTHGHQVGDAVLREAARRLRDLARQDELVARIGGEEFAWILPEAGGAEAQRAAERARACVAATPFGTAGQVTLSAGIATSAPGAAPSALVALADRALYTAKADGRDRVVLGDPQPSSTAASSATSA